jgi:hypothetical protein
MSSKWVLNHEDALETGTTIGYIAIIVTGTAIATAPVVGGSRSITDRAAAYLIAAFASFADCTHYSKCGLDVRTGPPGPARISAV